MSKFNKIVLSIPCVLFCIWYIVTSYANIYACDDFWHGTNVHNFGFFNAQSHYWRNWEGSYIHTFLATLPHLFNYEKTPFICNILSTSLLFCSIYTFVKTYFSITKSTNILSSLYIVAFLYTFTTGEAEIRFWVCANNTYIFGISTLLLFMAYYHNLNTKVNKNNIFGLIFLIFTLGNKVSYIYMVFICIFLHDIIYRKITPKMMAMYMMLVSILSLPNILAPGNFIRLAENTYDIGNDISFIETILYRLTKLLPYCGYTLLLFPISKYFNVTFNKKMALIGTFAMLLLFIGDTLIMYICFRDSGPQRANILLEVAMILYSLFIIFPFFHSLKSTQLSTCMLCIFITIFTYSQYTMINQIKQSYLYSKLAKERNFQISNSEDMQYIELRPLPDSGLLLSYFCNEKGWIENVYIPYFSKKLEIVIKDGGTSN